VGKGYAGSDMFKLNVVASSSGNAINVSSYVRPLFHPILALV